MPAGGPNPQSMICTSCHQQIVTKVKPKASTKTHVMALILCIFACWPCACCLYCTDCARNAVHFCPKCNALLGIYER